MIAANVLTNDELLPQLLHIFLSRSGATFSRALPATLVAENISILFDGVRWPNFQPPGKSVPYLLVQRVDIGVHVLHLVLTVLLLLQRDRHELQH
jgi:hypothetical protein